MSAGGARGTVHFKVARFTGRLTRTEKASSFARDKRGQTEQLLSSPDPDERSTYVYSVVVGWLVLGVICVVAIGVLAFPARSLFGSSVGDPIAYGCAGAAMFCAVGLFNALWRLWWYIPQARRRARTHGPGSEQFATSMRRALPRNTSLLLQGAVGVLTIVLAY